MGRECPSMPPTLAAIQLNKRGPEVDTSCWKPCWNLKYLWFEMGTIACLHHKTQQPQKQFCRNKINLPTKVQVLSSISEAHVALVPNHSNGICWTSDEYSHQERQLSSVLRDGNPTTCLSIFTASTNSYFMMIPISPIYRTSFGWEDFVLTRHIHNFFHCCTSSYIH